MTAHASAEIKNEAGIHCRPSTHIVKTMMGCPASVRVIREDGEESDLESMLTLMMLALTHGTTVDVEVTGEDEDHWCEEVVKLLETEYDFPQD